MNDERYHAPPGLGTPGPGTAVGVDVGATLAKLALRIGNELSFSDMPSEALDGLAQRVEAAQPRRVGLTGGGASALERRLRGARPADGRDGPALVRVNEFRAWGTGANALQDAGSASPYLLICMGTGTSLLRVAGGAIDRVGGTALGGGSVLGLGALLLGTRSFPEIAALAERGRRGRVDLLLSDVYPDTEHPLAKVVTASAFGRVAWRNGATTPSREDIACALMALVGENVGLLARALARANQVARVVLAGTTLRDESVLSRALHATLVAHGETAVALPRAGFAGALGALRIADEAQ